MRDPEPAPSRVGVRIRVRVRGAVVVCLLAAACHGGPTAASTTTAPVAVIPSAPASTAPTTTTTTATTEPTIPDRAAADPGTLGRQLGLAETLVRTPGEALDQVAAAGRLQQRAYRLLGDHPDWLPDVLAQVPADLRVDVADNLTANLALRRLGGDSPPLDEMPAWRIVDPPPASDLLAYYREAEGATGVSWTYLAAINLVETRMGRIVGLSIAGAQGPMQFLPSTWAGCCEGDINDPHDAIVGAAVYLRSDGAPDDMAGALRHYNDSADYVAAITTYAGILARNELAYRGYHAWEVYVGTSMGSIRLTTGYEEPEPVPVADWLARHPGAITS